MSENRKKTRKTKKFQKSTFGNPTKPQCEDERTCDHKGSANEVEDVDPDIVEDSDADIHQDPRFQICRGYFGGWGGGGVSKNWECQFIFAIYWFCFFWF